MHRLRVLTALATLPVFVLALAWQRDTSEVKFPDAAPRHVTMKGTGNAPLDNRVAFARLFGVVRYFHPSDGVADADWDSIAIAGMKKVDAAKTPEQLAKILQEI